MLLILSHFLKGDSTLSQLQLSRMKDLNLHVSQAMGLEGPLCDEYETNEERDIIQITETQKPSMETLGQKKDGAHRKSSGRKKMTLTVHK